MGGVLDLRGVGEVVSKCGSVRCQRWNRPLPSTDIIKGCRAIVSLLTQRGIMNVRGLSDECERWWAATAIHFGYIYRGRASVKDLMQAIYEGKIKLTKEVDKSN